MKSKFKIHMNLERDKFQYKLCALGIEKNNSPLKTITTLNYQQNIFCPFCLHKESISKFFISTKKGIHKGLLECPECKNRTRIETVLRMLKWTPKEYAEFIYEYPYGAFWAKCSNNYYKWKIRLYNLDMHTDFWLQYKHLKEQDSYTEAQTEEIESYEEFKERMKQQGIEIA